MVHRYCLVLILLVVVSGAQIQNLVPVELISLSLTKQNIPEYDEVPTKFTATLNLKTNQEELQESQVIGSISQINTLNDYNLSIEFQYNLQPKKQQISILFTIRSETPISETFKMVIDFMVAKVPSDYSIQIFNMTAYQEHIMYKTDRSYQLVYFINGFSNISLSGNITHAYNMDGEMYTVHYMGCLDDEAERGWKKGKDYVLFTAIVIPTQRKIQKFHLYETYSVDYESGFNYFYGLKAVESPRFSGHFESKVNGVTFKVEENVGKKSFGLVLLQFETDDSYIQLRVHESSFNVFYIVVVVLFLILLGIGIYWKALTAEKKTYLVEESGRIEGVSVVTEGNSGCGQNSSNIGSIGGSKKTTIDPIVEVNESLETSHPGTKHVGENKIKEEQKEQE